MTFGTWCTKQILFSFSVVCKLSSRNDHEGLLTDFLGLVTIVYKANITQDFLLETVIGGKGGKWVAVRSFGVYIFTDTEIKGGSEPPPLLSKCPKMSYKLSVAMQLANGDKSPIRW